MDATHDSKNSETRQRLMNWDVIVVGGGCAGLSAASSLAESGKRVLVLERRPLLGGRASSFRDSESGEDIDNGQHLMLGCYVETQEYLKRIGSIDDLHFYPTFEAILAGPSGERSKLKAGHFPAPFHLASALLRFRALPLKDRLRAMWVGRAAKRNGKDLSAISTTKWLTDLRQSKEAREKLWDLLILATLNIHPDLAPASLFQTVMKDGFLRSSQSSKVGLSQVGLSKLLGDPAKAFIEKWRGEVRLKSVVRSVRQNQDGWEVELEGDEVEFCRDLILAIPPSALEKLASSSSVLRSTSGKTTEMKPSPIVSLHVWLKKPWPLEDHFVGFWGTTFHWLFQKKFFSKDRPTHLSFVISAAESAMKLSKAELLKVAEKELSEFAREEIKVERVVMVREPEATWVPPLKHNEGRLSTQVGIPHLYFAGDWTDTGLPCTIESAVKSGHHAAKLLQESR